MSTNYFVFTRKRAYTLFQSHLRASSSGVKHESRAKNERKGAKEKKGKVRK